MLIQNAIQNRKTGEIYKSNHVHDFVTIVDSFGVRHYIDGGNEYCRSTIFDHPEFESLLLTPQSTSEEINDKLVWGHRGIDGKSPLAYKRIKHCDLDHLKAILNNVTSVDKLHREIITNWIRIKS